MPGGQDFQRRSGRNEKVLIYLNGALVPREEGPRVSSSTRASCWATGYGKGLRLHKGRLLFLETHLERLYDGARAIALDIGLSREEMVRALRRTVEANAMESGVHIRLMVTRGPKKAPNQDPRNCTGGAHHRHRRRAQGAGREMDRHARPQARHVVDPLHAKRDVRHAAELAQPARADPRAARRDRQGGGRGADARSQWLRVELQRDEFLLREGRRVAHLQRRRFCFNGVTRANVIALAQANGIAIKLGDFTLDEARAADEAFVTGTFGGLTPVREIDFYTLPLSLPGPMTTKLRALYSELKDRDADG